jgi:hypothetical protein
VLLTVVLCSLVLWILLRWSMPRRATPAPKEFAIPAA